MCSPFLISEVSILSSVWTVLGNKQIQVGKSVVWHHLGKQIVILHIVIFFLPGCSHIRKRQSKMGKLKCIKQIMDRGDTYQVRGSVSVHLDFLLCLLTGNGEGG